MIVEYAGLVSAFALLAATLSGSYGQNVAAVFASGATSISTVAKAAYKRAPYTKPALKYLYAMGWIGGTKNPGQCGLTLLGQDAATDQTRREIRSNPKLMAQLRKRAVSVSAAANALVKGVVSACA